MPIYILKSTACLALFYMFYKLFLEHENMHFFKRFYLIGMLFMSFLIPLITITTYGDVLESAPVDYVSSKMVAKNDSLLLDMLPQVLLFIYFVGFVLFAGRFFNNLSAIVSRIKGNEHFSKQFYVNVLLAQRVTPHTFFKYIFLNKAAFESNTIPEEVLLHEQSHAAQRHSIDIVLIEIIQIIFWFNPLVYLVKSSIKLNHEFLADQAVLSKGIPLSHYQETLLLFSTTKASPILANSINYSLIKKRFTIMKTKTSKNKILFRSLWVLPLLAILVFSFSTKQEISGDETSTSVLLDNDGASKAEIKEYNKLAKFYNEMDASKMVIKQSDVERLHYLYDLMTAGQRKKVESFPSFPPAPPTPPKPVKVIKGVNDKDANIPPPPPKPVKVILGVNDKDANVPPPPPKPIKVVKGVNDKDANIPPAPPKSKKTEL
jgi:hypothetical protein